MPTGIDDPFIILRSRINPTKEEILRQLVQKLKLTTLKWTWPVYHNDCWRKMKQTYLQLYSYFVPVWNITIQMMPCSSRSFYHVRCSKDQEKPPSRLSTKHFSVKVRKTKHGTISQQSHLSTTINPPIFPFQEVGKFLVEIKTRIFTQTEMLRIIFKLTC